MFLVLSAHFATKVKGPVWRYCLSIPMVVNRCRKAVDENTFAAICKLLEDAYRPTAKIYLCREWALLSSSTKKEDFC